MLIGLALGSVQARILVYGVSLRSTRTAYFSAVMEGGRRRRGVESEDADEASYARSSWPAQSKPSKFPLSTKHHEEETEGNAERGS